MNQLKELHKQIKDIIKYFPTYCSECYEEFQKYTQINILINTIVDLSSLSIARALDSTIKEISYALPESNFEVRERYLESAIIDLVNGMDSSDVLMKYDRILYEIKGVRHD